MATYKFTRDANGSGKLKAGREVILNKYEFMDGILEVDEELGKMYRPILCGYYGCKVEIIADPVEVAISNVDPSLKANETKPGAGNAANAEAGKQ